MTSLGIPLVAALALAATVAAILAVLHLLRVRPRPVRVVTTLFWQQAIEQPKARTLRHRFRHPRTYALLALIGALLSVALARPQWSGSDRHVAEVIIVDAGLSMATRDAGTGRSRFDEARELALTEAKRLSLTDEVAVLIARPFPELIHGFDDPRPALQAALAEAGPGAAPAAHAEAVDLARDLLQDRAQARVLIITDRALDQTMIGGMNEPQVRTAIVGRPASNAAIVGAQFTPDPANPLRGRFAVRVGYWGAEPGEVAVRIHRAGGAPLLDEVVRLEPGATGDVTLVDVPADGDELVAQLTTADALAADDRMAYRLPLRQVIRVALPDNAPLSLRLALASDPAVRLVGESAEHDVSVVLGDRPQTLPKPSFWIPDDGPAGLANAPVTVRAEAALTAGLDFEGAMCGAGATLPAFDEEHADLIIAGPAVLAIMLSRGEAPCCGLAPALLDADSGLPRTAAFPVFIARTLRRLAGWDDAPLVLPVSPTGDADSVWAGAPAESGTVARAPGAREASDTSVPADFPVPASVLSEPRRSIPEPFEWLLAVALALLVVEAVLHVRGRIP